MYISPSVAIVVVVVALAAPVAAAGATAKTNADLLDPVAAHRDLMTSKLAQIANESWDKTHYTVNGPYVQKKPAHQDDTAAPTHEATDGTANTDPIDPVAYYCHYVRMCDKFTQDQQLLEHGIVEGSNPEVEKVLLEEQNDVIGEESKDCAEVQRLVAENGDFALPDCGEDEVNTIEEEVEDEVISEEEGADGEEHEDLIIEDEGEEHIAEEEEEEDAQEEEEETVENEEDELTKKIDELDKLIAKLKAEAKDRGNGKRYLRAV